MGQQRFDNDGEIVPVLVGGLDAQLDRVVQAEPARAFLLVAAGDRPGRVFALTRNTIMVGRSPDADVRLSDPSVSNEHARIINGGFGYEVEDLQSRNGTFVGGRRVGRARLGNGDRLRLGTVEFTFLLDGAPEATVALAPPTMSVSPTVLPVERRLPAATSDDDEDGPSVEEMVRKGFQVYRMLRKHTATMLLMVGIGVGGGLASIFVLPPAPAARSLIKLHPEVKVNPVEAQRPPQETLQFFAGAERAFTSGDLIKTTLVKMGETPANDDIRGVETRLKFENQGDQVYMATYQESGFGRARRDPALFLDTHMKNYVQTEIDKTLKVFTSGVMFLRSSLKTVEADLAKLNAESVEFRERNSDQLQDSGATGSRLSMETRRSELMALIQRLQGELDSERRQLATGAALAQSKLQGSQTYRENLAQVNRKLNEARARGLADEHPEIKQLLGEKSSLESMINEQLQSEATNFERRSNVAYQEIHNKIESLRAQLDAARSEAGDLGNSIKRLKQSANELPRIDTRLAELSHLQEANQKHYAKLFDELKKAEIQLELERVSVASRFEILSAPELDRPGRLKTLGKRVAIGLVAGLFIAALLIGVREGRRVVESALAKERHATG